MTRKQTFEQGKISDQALEGILQRVAARPQQAAGADFESRIRALPQQHAQSQAPGRWLQQYLRLSWPQVTSLATAGILGFVVGSASLTEQSENSWNGVDPADLIFLASPYDDVTGEDL